VIFLLHDVDTRLESQVRRRGPNGSGNNQVGGHPARRFAIGPQLNKLPNKKEATPGGGRAWPSPSECRCTLGRFRECGQIETASTMALRNFLTSSQSSELQIVCQRWMYANKGKKPRILDCRMQALPCVRQKLPQVSLNLSAGIRTGVRQNRRRGREIRIPPLTYRTVKESY
jgi:hypothetical protein